MMATHIMSLPEFLTGHVWLEIVGEPFERYREYADEAR